VRQDHPRASIFMRLCNVNAIALEAGYRWLLGMSTENPWVAKSPSRFACVLKMEKFRQAGFSLIVPDLRLEVTRLLIGRESWIQAHFFFPPKIRK
jgi:hypothetical protein